MKLAYIEGQMIDISRRGISHEFVDVDLLGGNSVKKSRGRILKTTAIVAIVVLVVVGSMSMVVAAERPKFRVWGSASFAPAQMYWTDDRLRAWAGEKGVDIEIAWFPANEYWTKIVAAVAAGNAPDVAIHAPLYAQFSEAGLLLPLGDVIDKLGRDDILEIKFGQARMRGGEYSLSKGTLEWA